MFSFLFNQIVVSEVKAFLWNTFVNANTTARPLQIRHQIAGDSSEYHTGQNMDRMKHRNTTPYMLWNNSPLEENPTIKPGIEPETFWSVESDITIKPSGRIINQIITMFPRAVDLGPITRFFHLLGFNYTGTVKHWKWCTWLRKVSAKNSSWTSSCIVKWIY